MRSTMIVVADTTIARFFTADSADSPLHEIETMVHPESRLHDREITSDLPGKGKGGNKSGGHAYQGETDPKKHEVTLFAKQVAIYLDDARKANKMASLLVVATPGFLGEMRMHLSSDTSKKIVFELDKRFTHCSPADIRNQLPKYLTH